MARKEPLSRRSHRLRAVNRRLDTCMAGLGLGLPATLKGMVKKSPPPRLSSGHLARMSAMKRGHEMAPEDPATFIRCHFRRGLNLREISELPGCKMSYSAIQQFVHRKKPFSEDVKRVHTLNAFSRRHGLNLRHRAFERLLISNATLGHLPLAEKLAKDKRNKAFAVKLAKLRKNLGLYAKPNTANRALANLFRWFASLDFDPDRMHWGYAVDHNRPISEAIRINYPGGWDGALRDLGFDPAKIKKGVTGPRKNK